MIIGNLDLIAAAQAEAYQQAYLEKVAEDQGMSPWTVGGAGLAGAGALAAGGSYLGERSLNNRFTGLNDASIEAFNGAREAARAEAAAAKAMRMAEWNSNTPPQRTLGEMLQGRRRPSLAAIQARNEAQFDAARQLFETQRAAAASAAAGADAAGAAALKNRVQAHKLRRFRNPALAVAGAGAALGLGSAAYNRWGREG